METLDIPGYFFQTYETISNTHLKFYETMAELLDHIDPYLYRKYITTEEKGHNIMYDACMKDLYGTVDAELLLWEKLRADM